MPHSKTHGRDVLIIGAGASGLMCARTAASRGLDVLVLDHAASCGKKIRISGGGKCNFTNLNVSPEDYVCANPHFVKSALARYTPYDFLDFMEKHGLPVTDAGNGMLFSTNASRVAEALYKDALDAGAAFQCNARIQRVSGRLGNFEIRLDTGSVSGARLVVACGSPARPQAGATNLGCDIAKSFGLRIVPLRPGLVPLTASGAWKPLCAALSGVSLPVRIAPPHTADGDLLFTHRGISGPAVLNASLAWEMGQTLGIDFLPGADIAAVLGENPRREIKNALARLLPKRLAAALCDLNAWTGPVGAMPPKTLDALAARIHDSPFKPSGTEGFAKAEVAVGGVDTAQISSKTMEAPAVPGLYFTGEVLDVAGRLGGFNLHWAWASGAAAGRETPISPAT